MTAAPMNFTYAVEAQEATRIRAAGQGDLPIILSVLEEAGSHTGSVTLDGSTYWIAFLAGQSAGTIGLEHGVGASLLRSAAVRPQYRGLALGRALALGAITLATLRGDRAVYLFSSEAGGYWQRLGFRQVSAEELAQALPDAPQVRSGVQRGWIHQETAWRLDLVPTIPGVVP